MELKGLLAYFQKSRIIIIAFFFSLTLGMDSSMTFFIFAGPKYRRSGTGGICYIE